MSRFQIRWRSKRNINIKLGGRQRGAALALAAFLEDYTDSVSFTWQIVYSVVFGIEPAYMNTDSLKRSHSISQELSCGDRKYSLLKGELLAPRGRPLLRGCGKDEASAYLCNNNVPVWKRWLGRLLLCRGGKQHKNSQVVPKFRFSLDNHLPGWWRLQHTCEFHSGGVCLCSFLSSLHLLLFLSVLLSPSCSVWHRTLCLLFPTGVIN